MRAPLKILIIRPDKIGDVVLTIPLIQSLHSTYPQADIYVLVQPYTESVLAQHPAVKGMIMDWRAMGRVNTFAQFKHYAAHIRSFEFDQVYFAYLSDFYVALCMFAKIPIRIGDGNKVLLRPFLTHPVTLPTRHLAYHETELLVQLLTASHTHFTVDMMPRVYIGREEELLAQYLLKEAGWAFEPLVIIHFGTGGSNRAWSIASYAKCIDYLSEHYQLTPVLTGNGQDEIELSKQLCALCKHKPINLVGKTKLTTLKALLQKAKAFISTDTGPMHLAGAMGIPVLCLAPTKFTKMLRYGPWLPPQIVIQDTTTCQLSCNPRTCLSTACIDALRVEEVCRGFDALMSHPMEGKKAIKGHWFKQTSCLALVIDNLVYVDSACDQYKQLTQEKYRVLIVCTSQEILNHMYSKEPSIEVLGVMPYWQWIHWIKGCYQQDISVIYTYSQPSFIWRWVIRQFSALWMYTPPVIAQMPLGVCDTEDLIKEYLDEHTSY